MPATLIGRAVSPTLPAELNAETGCNSLCTNIGASNFTVSSAYEVLIETSGFFERPLSTIVLQFDAATRQLEGAGYGMRPKG